MALKVLLECLRPMGRLSEVRKALYRFSSPSIWQADTVQELAMGATDQTQSI